MIRDLINSKVDATSPINQSVNDKYLKPNPAYNPKTKKGSIQSPYIEDTTPRDRYGGFWYEYRKGADRLNWDNIDLGMTPEEMDSYSKYNISVTPYNSKEEYQRQRAENQSALEQWRNASIQILGNELVLGTIKSFTDLFDFFTLNQGGDYSNPVSAKLEEWQNAIRNKYAIYGESNDSFRFGDLAWWLEGAVSAASSASLFIPGAGVMKGLSLLGKIKKLSNLTNKLNYGIAKATKAITNTNKSTTRIANALQKTENVALQGLIQRTSENYMEARQVYTETYDEALNRLQNMSEQEKVDLIKRNPEMLDMTDEERAKYIAGQSADETFKNDYAMLLMDMMQIKALGRLWKAAPSEIGSVRVRGANRQSIKDIINKTTDDAKKNIDKYSWFNKRYDAIKDMVKHPTKVGEMLSLSEAPEEMYQGWSTERGKEVAKMIFDPEYTPRDIESYLRDPTIWEQGFYGAFGGILYQKGSKGIINLARKGKSYYDYKKGKISKEDYKANLTSEDKRRIAEIKGRAALNQNVLERLSIIRRGEDPDNFEKDENNNIIEIDGIQQRKKLNKEQQIAKAEEILSDYSSKFAINAIRVGNWDLALDYLQSKEFKQFFEDAGFTTNDNSKSMQDIILEKAKESANLYSDNLAVISGETSVDTPELAHAFASELTSEQLRLKSFEEKRTALREQINKINTNVGLSEKYKALTAIKHIKDQLKELNDKEEDLYKIYTGQNDNVTKRTKDLKRLSATTISKQGYEQYKREFNEKRRALINQLQQYTIFTGGTFKNIIDAYNQNTNLDNIKGNSIKLIEDIEQEYNTYFNTEEGTVPNAVKDLLDAELYLDEQIEYLKEIQPKNKEQYDTRIKDLERKLIHMGIIRASEAATKIEKWLKEQQDLDKAFKDMMEDKVPELKDDLDLLRLGYMDFPTYYNSILATIQEEVKRREEEKKKENTVISNGQQTNEQRTQEIKNDLQEIDDNSNRAELEQQEENKNQEQTDNTQQNNENNNIENTDTNSQNELQSDTNQNQTNQREQENPLEVDKPKPNQREQEAVEATVQGVTEEADKLLEKANPAPMDYGFLTADMLAVGTASGFVFKLFNDEATKYLFEQAIGKDINSPEVQAIVDKVVEYLENNRVSVGVARNAALRGTKQALKTIARRIKTKNPTMSEQLVSLAEEIIVKQQFSNADDGLNAKTKELPDNVPDSIIDEFLDKYMESRGATKRKGKQILNLDRLIYDLVKEENISLDEIAYLLYNMRGYINNGGLNKYVFIGKRKLTDILKNPLSYFNEIVNERANQETTLDNYMHISAPSKKDANFDRVINSIKPGDEIEIIDNGGGSISFIKDGVEIGFVAKVSSNSTNDEFELSAISAGIKYKVKKIGNTYSSNLDELINLLLDQNGEYWNILENFRITKRLNYEDIQKLITNPIIYNLFKNGTIILPKQYRNNATNEEKIRFLINKLYNVIYYKQTELTEQEYRDSYQQWLKNIYINYSNTFTLQNRVQKGKKTKIKFGGFGTSNNIANIKPIFSNIETNVNSSKFGFTYDRNPIFAVTDDNGTIVNETTGEQFTIASKPFKAGTMGMFIGGRNDSPMLALLTSPNEITDRHKKLVKQEIIKLLTDYQNGNLTIDDLYNSLVDLFSGPTNNPNEEHYSLFEGYNVIKTSTGIALNINGIKGSYNLIIYEKQKNSDKNSTGITYLPNGDKTKSKTTIKLDKKFLEVIADEITNNLVYKNSFFTVKHREDNNKNNRYFYKENGKLVLEINGVKEVYDCFGDFILKNNAFKTNQGVNENGGLFNNTDAINSIYIDVATIEYVDTSSLPVEERVSPTQAIVNSGKDGVEIRQLYTLQGIPTKTIDFLLGENEFGISLIPERIWYDKKITGARGRYRKGKIYISTEGANLATTNSNFFRRTILHENLHAQFDKHNLFSRAGIVNDLINTYEQTIAAINDIIENSSDPKLSIEAKRIRDWINASHFTPSEYFTHGTKENISNYEKLSEEERRRIFAEEWLVESLTNPTLINFLNSIEYRGESVAITNIENEKKSIFQKIIDLLLKLFDINTSNIKDNTIFAKQYQILSDNINNGNNNRETNEKSISNEQDVTKTNNISQSTDNIDTTNAEENIEKNIDEEIEEDSDEDSEYLDDSDNDISKYARTEELTDFIDDVANDGNATAKTFGITRIDSMNEYLQSYPPEFRTIIVQMIERGELKFACQ